MTAPESVFERVLRQFKAKLSAEDQAKFGGTTLPELQRTITQIQTAQKSKRTLQNMKRLEGFLEAMEMYAKVLDVFVNVNDFVAFIWGPVKYLLLIAKGVGEAFNALLDAYQSISENLPMINQFQKTFGCDDRMRQALEAIFEDIFQFHLEAWKCFNRSMLKQVFAATWNGFHTRFDHLLNDMRRHKRLIETQASLIDFEQAKDDRALARQAVADQEKHEHLRRLTYLYSWLKAADYTADHDRFSGARTWKPDSGSWLLTKSQFRLWTVPSTATSPLLWIHGMPGSGKTVLASVIIEHLRRTSNKPVLFFYFRQDDASRNSFVSMATALLHQLLSLDESLVPHVFETAAKSGQSSLTRRNLAETILETHLTDAGELNIVLDGLDECPEVEQKHIVSWMQNFAELSVVSQKRCSCAFISQDDAITGPLLKKLPRLPISREDTKSDILEYCTIQAADIGRKFDLAVKGVNDLVQRTSMRADGMFLFAKLVMDNLYHQPSKARLEAEMQEDNFPCGLDDAYSRILNRILVGAPQSLREPAKQILAWLVCAIRPMKWREIQTARSIDIEEETVDHDRHGLVDRAKALCGSLVEEAPNDDILLVHSTAKPFLIKERHVDPSREHLKLATLCLDYFCLPIFKMTHEAGDELDHHILTGCFGFMDYATASWSEHLQAALSTTPIEPSARTELECTLEAFFTLHWNPPVKTSRPTKDILAIAEQFESHDWYAKLRDTLSCMHALMSFNLPNTEQIVATNILLIVPNVRKRIENLAARKEELPKIHKFHGEHLFKCPRLHCKSFYEGFPDETSRATHVEKHDRPYFCPQPGCLMSTMGCATQQELNHHIQQYHDAKPTENEFPDALDQGSRAKRGQKRPGNHLCDQCDRAFPKPSNLRAHMLTHTEERPYACSTCPQAFKLKGDLKRHEVSHGEGKKFKCPSATCTKQYPRGDGLLRHLQTVQGQHCLLALRGEAAEDDLDTADLIRREIQRQSRLRHEPASESPAPPTIHIQDATSAQHTLGSYVESAERSTLQRAQDLAEGNLLQSGSLPESGSSTPLGLESSTPTSSAKASTSGFDLTAVKSTWTRDLAREK